MCVPGASFCWDAGFAEWGAAEPAGQGASILAGKQQGDDPCFLQT